MSLLQQPTNLILIREPTETNKFIRLVQKMTKEVQELVLQRTHTAALFAPRLLKLTEFEQHKQGTSHGFCDTDIKHPPLRLHQSPEACADIPNPSSEKATNGSFCMGIPG